MKKNIKKILTATVVSAISFSVIGCSSSNTKVAKNIDKSMSDFVLSINNLDYVETAKATSATPSKYGKIVETAAELNNEEKPQENKIKIINTKNGNVHFLNNKIDEVEIENTITRPEERTDNFKLFVLSESPFISLTSNDNSASLNMSIKFSTDRIEETSSEIETKINTLILKRSILMIYVNEVYNGNVNFTEENKVAINAYVNVIKENTSYLNGNRGMVKNQLGLASDLVSSDSNENLVNYYIIKSGEALETRASKLDSAISAIDSIIKIIESNLTSTSKYYQSDLSATYDNIISNLGKTSYSEITKDSTNKEIAESIANSLNFNGKQADKTEIENNQNTNVINSKSKVNNVKINPFTPQSVQGNQFQLNEQTKQSQKNQFPLNNNQSNNFLNLRNNQNEQNINSYENQFNSSNLLNNNNQPQNKINNLNNQNQIIKKSENDDKNLQLRKQTFTNSSTRANRRLARTNRPTLKQGEFSQNINEQSTFNQNENSTTNSSKSVMNMNNENQKIMRAERSPEKQTREEYTTSNSNQDFDDINRVNTVPFTRNVK